MLTVQKKTLQTLFHKSKNKQPKEFASWNLEKTSGTWWQTSDTGNLPRRKLACSRISPTMPDCLLLLTLGGSRKSEGVVRIVHGLLLALEHRAGALEVGMDRTVHQGVVRVSSSFEESLFAGLLSH